MDKRLEKIRYYKGSIEDLDSYIKDRAAQTKAERDEVKTPEMKHLRKQKIKENSAIRASKYKKNDEKTKTYSDIMLDMKLDEQMLQVFVEMYKKSLTLDTKETDFIKESAENCEECSARDIENMLENAANEGIIGGIFGGITGLAFGSKIGAAVCKAIGVTSGPLYQLLNSKIVTTAICTYLGIKL